MIPGVPVVEVEAGAQPARDQLVEALRTKRAVAQRAQDLQLTQMLQGRGSVEGRGQQRLQQVGMMMLLGCKSIAFVHQA